MAKPTDQRVTRRRVHPFPYSLAVVCLAATLGCGVAKKTKSLFGGNFPIEVEVAADVNQDNPIAVDLLVVYKKKVLDELLELSAAEWFAAREQRARDYPKSFDVWSWEWVPGQRVPTLSLPFKLGAAGGLVFADYLAPGEHRVRIDPYEPIRIELAAAGFEIASLKDR